MIFYEKPFQRTHVSAGASEKKQQISIPCNLEMSSNGVLYLQNIVLEIIYNRFPIGYHASRKIKRMVERK